MPRSLKKGPFIDLHLHSDLIPVARDEAINLLNNDNDHEKINTLLSIFAMSSGFITFVFLYILERLFLYHL